MSRQIARRGSQGMQPGQGQLAGHDPMLPVLEANDQLLLHRMMVAKRFPRDDEAARRRLSVQAPAMTEEWGYQWPVKNKKTNRTELVAGPSIKCANAVILATDNIDVRVNVVETDDAWVFTVGILDLERNSNSVRAYRQRRDQVVMADQGRNDDILFALGQSKAIRNAAVNYLQELVNFAYDESRKSLLATIYEDEGFDPKPPHKKLNKSPPRKFRTRIFERLEALNVPLERVAQWVGRGERAWTVEDLAKITGVLTAVVDGVISADSMWPDRVSAPPAPPPPPPARNETPPPADIPDGPPGPDGDDEPNPGNQD